MTAPPRAPGAYSAPIEQQRFIPLTLWPAGIPGFVGVAERGPTNAPVRITSEKRFRQVFGELAGEGYLGTSVRGFFENGGGVCYVLRVAHKVRRGREEVARPASVKLLNSQEQPTLVVNAASEGVWGNRVRVTVARQEPRTQTFLTLDLREGDTSAVIKSTLGLERGTIVRIYDGEHETHRTVVELSGKTISWANEKPLEQPFRSGAPTFIEPVELTIEARWGADTERHRNLSMSPISERYVERVINRDSRTIRVQDLRIEAGPPAHAPAALAETALTGGSDGLFTVTPEDFIGANIGPGERFGLAAFEALDEVDLLVAPDLMWALEKSAGFRTEKDVEVVQQAMVSQAERLKTRFAILDFPDPVDHRRASQWRLLFDTKFAAFYYPWVSVDTLNGVQLVPPSGHVAGVYARCDAAQGTYRAPANEDVHGIFDVGRVLRDDDIGVLNERGINCLRPVPRRGIRVWGARTASSDAQWRFINVRRVMNTVIASMERGLQWAVFETNSPNLWKTLTREVTSFLMELWQAGYFRGPSPEDAFFVKCDEEINPPEVRDAGQVIVECGVAPVRPAEYIIFRVSADISGPSDE